MFKRLQGNTGAERGETKGPMRLLTKPSPSVSFPGSRWGIAWVGDSTRGARQCGSKLGFTHPRFQPRPHPPKQKREVPHFPPPSRLTHRVPTSPKIPRIPEWHTISHLAGRPGPVLRLTLHSSLPCRDLLCGSLSFSQALN